MRNAIQILEDVYNVEPSARGRQFEGSMHEYWNTLVIPPGTFNERCLLWLNSTMRTRHLNIDAAIAAIFTMLSPDEWPFLPSLSADADTVPAMWGGAQLTWGGEELIW